MNFLFMARFFFPKSVLVAIEHALTAALSRSREADRKVVGFLVAVPVTREAGENGGDAGASGQMNRPLNLSAGGLLVIFGGYTGQVQSKPHFAPPESVGGPTPVHLVEL
jgi:hypothetical protein